MRLNITHTPGRHCASSGIADICRFHGQPWSEALCFGVGLGLGTWYLDLPGMPVSRMVHVRSQDIEKQFFSRMGLEFEWEEFKNGKAANRALKAALDDGRPAIIQSDIFHLPYYGTSTHFPGHVIAVWGYDPEKEVFLVTDTERPAPQEVPFGAMEKARFSKDGFFDIKGFQFAPLTIETPADLPAVVERAVVDQARAMIQPAWDMGGLAAFDRFFHDLDRWPGFKDWQWTARFAYQVIEKRGTGGGGFRLMYADFLREAGAMLPRVEELGLADMMDQCARAWTELAGAMRQASERQAPDFSAVGPLIKGLGAKETLYHQTAIQL